MNEHDKQWIKGLFDEQNQMLSKAFTAFEKRLDVIEKRLAHKVDGIRNSLDGEIIRRTDEFAQVVKRISLLEELQGISLEEVN